MAKTDPMLEKLKEGDGPGFAEALGEPAQSEDNAGAASASGVA